MASLDYVREAEPDLTYYLHLHNAHGQALATVQRRRRLSESRFDAALGGFGGCPFAPGAHGNIATEELVRHLHAGGHETGIDEERLADAVRARPLTSPPSPPPVSAIQPARRLIVSGPSLLDAAGPSPRGLPLPHGGGDNDSPIPGTQTSGPSDGRRDL